MAAGRAPGCVLPPYCANRPRPRLTVRHRAPPKSGGDGGPVPPQTSQGVQVRRFKTLSELIALYLQPNQGLVCTLLFAVEREKEKESAEDRDYSGTRGGPSNPPPPRGSLWRSVP